MSSKASSAMTSQLDNVPSLVVLCLDDALSDGAHGLPLLDQDRSVKLAPELVKRRRFGNWICDPSRIQLCLVATSRRFGFGDGEGECRSGFFFRGFVRFRGPGSSPVHPADIIE
jgi:hypothetical protein